MSSQLKDKKYFKNKIEIVIQNVTNATSTQNENITSVEINEEHDRNKEKINENVVDKYIQSIVKPMNIMDALFVCAKYSIRDDVITPNSRRYSAMSVSAAIILTVIVYIMFFMSPNTTGLDVLNYYFINIYDIILYFCGFFLDALTKIGQRLNNVAFVLKIQNVHRILNLNGSSFNCFIITNWACVIAINCFHLSWMCMYFFTFYKIGVANILTSYICIRFDMNIICAARNLKLLNKTLNSWMTELCRANFVNDAADDQYWEIIFQSYVDITQTFEIHEKSFHRQVGYLQHFGIM